MVATSNAQRSTYFGLAPYLRRFFIAMIAEITTAITPPKTLTLVIVSVIVM